MIRSLSSIVSATVGAVGVERALEGSRGGLVDETRRFADALQRGAQTPVSVPLVSSLLCRLCRSCHAATRSAPRQVL